MSPPLELLFKDETRLNKKGAWRVPLQYTGGHIFSGA